MMSNRDYVLAKLDLELKENYEGYADLYVFTKMTADGYDIFIMTEDDNNIDWENDVYYYQDGMDEHLIEILMEMSPGSLIYDGDELITDYVWDRLYEQIQEGDEDRFE